MPDINPASPADTPSARLTILALAGAQTLFWIYTIYYIVSHTSPKGGGMELVAIGPMTVIFGALVLPALMMARNRREGLKVPAILCLLALFANAIVWNQILGELAGSTAR